MGKKNYVYSKARITEPNAKYNSASIDKVKIMICNAFSFCISSLVLLNSQESPGQYLAPPL